MEKKVLLFWIKWQELRNIKMDVLPTLIILFEYKCRDMIESESY